MGLLYQIYQSVHEREESAHAESESGETDLTGSAERDAPLSLVELLARPLGAGRAAEETAAGRTAKTQPDSR